MARLTAESALFCGGFLQAAPGKGARRYPTVPALITYRRKPNAVSPYQVGSHESANSRPVLQIISARFSSRGTYGL